MVETARSVVQPRICQLSIFLENRVGQLLQLTKQLEAHEVNICAMAINDGADSAVIRMVVDNLAGAIEVFKKRGLTAYQCDMIAVEMPLRDGIDMASVLGTLLRAEVNINYVYPLIIRSHDNPVLAIHVDDPSLAAQVLMRHELTLLGQDDIVWEGKKGMF